MGKLLDSYLQQYGNQLTILADPQPAGPPIQQPSGATTFGLPQQPRPGAPMSFMAPGPVAQGPISRGVPGATPGIAPPSVLAPEQGMMKRTPLTRTLPEEAGPPSELAGPPALAPEEEKKGGSKGMDFQQVMEDADDEEIEAAIGAMEESGVDLDRAYAQATGRTPHPEMSRKEKGALLMEFGLRLLAHSDTGYGDTLGDIGRAGLETMGGMYQRRAAEGETARKIAKERRLTAREEREQRSSRLRDALTRAQTRKAERENLKIETSADGNLMIVNVDTGTAKTVTDKEGKPVKADPSTQSLFASQVEKATYEGEFCAGLTGSELKACKQRATAYAKGVREIAFPGVLRADVTDRVMKNLEHPDNRSRKYPVGPNRDLKRWKDMTFEEQEEVGNRLVDRQVSIIQQASGMQTTSPPAAGDKQFGLSSEQVASIPEGKTATLSNGKKVKKQGGKLVEVP